MKPLTRRAVVRGFGGLLISLPVLEGCTRLDGLVSGPPRERTGARREGLATPAKRFISLLAPDGVDPRLWWPSGTETAFTLNSQTAAYEAVKEHLLLLKGVDNKVARDSRLDGRGNGHAEGVASLLTGWGVEERVSGSNNWYARGGPSIDQLLSTLHEQAGYLGRTRGLYLGEEGAGSYSATSILPNLDRADFGFDLASLFDSSQNQTQTALENARLRNKSVLDGSMSDFQALSTRVSGEDKRRIDAHLEALRSIELRYQVANSCRQPTLNTNPADDNETRDLYYDVVTAAMACDATRVAVVAFRHCGGGGPRLPWVGVLDDIHELSHQVVSDPQTAASHVNFTKYHQWFQGKTASLVQKLKAVTIPGGGTLFDDTVIFQGSDLSFDHDQVDMPFVILAGGQTRFSTGRFVTFAPHALHTHLLTTLLHAFGHPATQVGDPQYVSGNLDARLFKA
jgi:Protein of unknown function (DUF1552)